MQLCMREPIPGSLESPHGVVPPAGDVTLAVSELTNTKSTGNDQINLHYRVRHIYGNAHFIKFLNKKTAKLKIY